MTTLTMTNPFDALDRYPLELLLESVESNHKLLCTLFDADQTELIALEMSTSNLASRLTELEYKIQDQHKLCEDIRAALAKKEKQHEERQQSLK